MRLVLIALIVMLLGGCVFVPAPVPVARVYGPSVSVGVGVPVYGYYGHPYYGPRYYYPYR